MSKDTVTVEFIQQGMSESFAVSEIPLKQLPDSFVTETMLNIAGKNWQVMGADPAQKSAFATTGSLKLFLEQIEMVTMNPEDVLYSLPTLYAKLPEVVIQEKLNDAVLVHEDDWRQFECISSRYEPQIHEMFTQIDTIYDEHSQGDGFNKVYLREGIKEPLKESGITLNLLRDSFDIEDEYEGIAFKDSNSMIINGFALYTNGWLLWGVADESEVVSVFNITQTEDFKVRRFAREMDRFLAENDLYLVDWTVLYLGGPEKLDTRAYCDDESQ